MNNNQGHNNQMPPMIIDPIVRAALEAGLAQPPPPGFQFNAFQQAQLLQQQAQLAWPANQVAPALHPQAFGNAPLGMANHPANAGGLAPHPMLRAGGPLAPPVNGALNLPGPSGAGRVQRGLANPGPSMPAAAPHIVPTPQLAVIMEEFMRTSPEQFSLALAEEIRRVREQAGELNRARVAREQQLGAARQTAAHLAGANRQQAAEMQGLREQLAAVTSQHDRAVQESRETVDTLRDQLANDAAQHQRAVEEMTRAHNRALHELEEKLAADARQHQQKVLELERAHNMALNEKDNAGTAAVHAQQKLADLENHLQIEQEATASLKAELETVRRRAGNAESSLQRAEAALARMVDELSTAQRSTGAAQHSSSLARLELVVSLERAKEEAMRAEDRAAGLTEEVERARVERARLEEELAVETSRATEAESFRNEAKTTIQKLQEKIEQLEQDNTELRNTERLADRFDRIADRLEHIYHFAPDVEVRAEHADRSRIQMEGIEGMDVRDQIAARRVLDEDARERDLEEDDQQPGTSGLPRYASGRLRTPEFVAQEDHEENQSNRHQDRGVEQQREPSTEDILLRIEHPAIRELMRKLKGAKGQQICLWDPDFEQIEAPLRLRQSVRNPPLSHQLIGLAKERKEKMSKAEARELRAALIQEQMVQKKMGVLIVESREEERERLVEEARRHLPARGGHQDEVGEEVDEGPEENEYGEVGDYQDPQPSKAQKINVDWAAFYRHLKKPTVKRLYRMCSGKRIEQTEKKAVNKKARGRKREHSRFPLWDELVERGPDGKPNRQVVWNVPVPKLLARYAEQRGETMEKDEAVEVHGELKEEQKRQVEWGVIKVESRAVRNEYQKRKHEEDEAEESMEMEEDGDFEELPSNNPPPSRKRRRDGDDDAAGPSAVPSSTAAC